MLTLFLFLMLPLSSSEAQQKAVVREQQYQAEQLQERFAEMQASMGQVYDALDIFAVRYNANRGKAVLIKESNEVNRKMKQAIKAWEKLHSSDVWIDTLEKERNIK